MAKLLNEAQILEQWSPVVNEYGVTNPEKKSWMSKYAHYHSLYEASTTQTLTNILGMGYVAPAQTVGSGSAFYNGAVGSGDKYPQLLPIAMQVAAKTVGFDIVSVVPMSGPSAQLTYFDYVYAGGRIDSAETPYMVKFDIAGTFTVGATYTVNGPSTNDGSFVYIGESRIDGQKIFKVVSLTNVGQTVAQTVVNGSTTIVDAGSTTRTVASSASLVKALEDHISGFAGAGYSDTDNWQGNGRNTTNLADAMGRGTGETTAYRPMGLQTYTKFVEAKTFQVAAGVTTEQIQDLSRQYNIDVISMVENVLVNEISQNINKMILDKAFALGWTNHFKFLKATPGATTQNLNLGNSTLQTFTYKGADGSSLAISGGTNAIVSGNFENTQTIQRKIVSRVLAAKNIVDIRSRRGTANFVVCNAQIATALQDNSMFQATPYQSSINVAGGSLYPLGTLNGMTVYTDPTMNWDDTRILVGRKGSDDEPGLKFCPYLMAESIYAIAEETMSPKIAVKSRFALVEAGQYPETMYFTFKVDVQTPIA